MHRFAVIKSDWERVSSPAATFNLRSIMGKKPEFKVGQVVMIDDGPDAGPALISSCTRYVNEGENCYWYGFRGIWNEHPESDLRKLTPKEYKG
jgi:hypothetical protein